MNRADLVRIIKEKQSFLCVGLDTDFNKIPSVLRNEKNPILSFNKAVIEATHDLCVAYKPNLAFYEAYGSKGLQALEESGSRSEGSRPGQATDGTGLSGQPGYLGRTGTAQFQSLHQPLPDPARTESAGRSARERSADSRDCPGQRFCFTRPVQPGVQGPHGSNLNLTK